MKRLVVLVLTLITIFSCSNVYAKDTVYSLNKYNEEIYKTINKSYSSEGKVDGYIVAGTYQKKDNEESENKNSKALVVKYDSYGKVLWTYTYGKDKNVDFNALTYLYDEESNVIGYEIILHDNNENKSYLIKINLSGKLLEEKELTLDNNVISKVKEIRASDNKFDSFIAIATNNEKTYLIKYDKEFNEIWKKEYIEEGITKAEYKDILPVYNNKELSGFVSVLEIEKDNSKITKVLKYDVDGNNTKTIKEDFTTQTNISLVEKENGFVIYGLTSDLKLQGDKTTSYFINSYNENDQEVNETTGTTPINSKKRIKLLEVKEENKLKEYLLLYTNATDESIEVVKINLDGVEENKIKKINNNYYDIFDFSSNKNTLYIVGQINCPDEDDCVYNNNSLFLISDEDKVIEVKESDNKNVIIISIVSVLVIVVLVLLRKKLKK